ncbi:MAG: hypothetical protein JSS91_00820 [Bacteroidetes bacterium]|nr:hypothetical protein [Bacteroidota bacterium]
MSEQPVYKIKEGQGEDPREVVKLNSTIEISLNTLSNELAYFNKAVTELESQAKIEEATMKNIEDHNPDIMVLPEEKMNAIMMFYQAKLKAKMLREKLAECQKTQTELIQMSKDIEEQTGLKA